MDKKDVECVTDSAEEVPFINFEHFIDFIFYNRLSTVRIMLLRSCTCSKQCSKFCLHSQSFPITAADARCCQQLDPALENLSELRTSASRKKETIRNVLSVVTSFRIWFNNMLLPFFEWIIQYYDLHVIKDLFVYHPMPESNDFHMVPCPLSSAVLPRSFGTAWWRSEFATVHSLGRSRWKSYPLLRCFKWRTSWLILFVSLSCNSPTDFARGDKWQTN